MQNDSNAKEFEDALDLIYPLGFSDKPEFKFYKKKDGKWYFLRGDFFDFAKGLIVELDSENHIIKINFVLEALPKSEE